MTGQESVHQLNSYSLSTRPEWKSAHRAFHRSDYTIIGEDGQNHCGAFQQAE